MGLHNVLRKDYATLEAKDKIVAAKEAKLMAHAAIVPGALLRSGKASNEAQAREMTEQLREILERHYDEGWDPVLPLSTIVGQWRG